MIDIHIAKELKKVELSERQEQLLTAFIAKSVPHRARQTFRAPVFKYLIVGAQGDAALKKGMCLALGEASGPCKVRWTSR
jgi:hypothetical protein